MFGIRVGLQLACQKVPSVLPR